MKRNGITILLLICAVALLVGSVFLYRTLSDLTSPASVQSPVQNGSEDAQPENTNEIIVFPDEGASEDGSSSAEIVQEDESLEPAADFVLTDRNGTEHRLSDYYGKPIIINFWATWCGPCQAELPHFDNAYFQYQDRIQFLMVDLVDGAYETEESASRFVDERGYIFPLFFDVNGEGSVAYAINAIPLTVAISPGGRIVATHLGSMSEEDLADLINTLLHES